MTQYVDLKKSLKALDSVYSLIGIEKTFKEMQFLLEILDNYPTKASFERSSLMALLEQLFGKKVTSFFPHK
jgi:hypothetical protein